MRERQKADLILFVVALFALLFLSLARVSGQDARTDALKTLQNMRLDLQLLQVSIRNYKTKIKDLSNLMEQSAKDLKTSQEELSEQKILLMESETNLTRMTTLYNESLITYQNLRKQYESSLSLHKVKNYFIVGLLAGCIIEGVVIALK
jgi:chromosome segregation ATPase